MRTRKEIEEWILNEADPDIQDRRFKELVVEILLDIRDLLKVIK